MTVTVEDVPYERRHVLERLIELYEYDFTEYDHRDVDEDGLFRYRYLPHYWRESDRHPLLIRADEKIAGFILVNSHVVCAEPGSKSIAEYFVMRAYRRRGVGREAACIVFDRFPGRWEVRQTATNIPAQAFWRSVVNDYTGGNYLLEEADDDDWHGPVLLFTNEGSCDD